MTSSTLPPPTAPREDFQEKASEVLTSLRSALTDMFLSVPGGGVRKSYDVNKLLGVDARLSWQLFKLTGPGDALSLAPHVPQPAAMKRLLAAALKHGFDTDRVEHARAAFDVFEKFVAEHAGDRSILEAMTRGQSDDDVSQQTDMGHRKSIFKGNRHFLGCELETSVTTVVNMPTSVDGQVDIAKISSKIGLRRFRTDSELIVDSPKVWTVANQETMYENTIDPMAARRYGAPLLPEFCTQPLPQLRTKDTPDGRRVTSLGGDILGRQGSVDLVFGNIWRGVRLMSADKEGVSGFELHMYINCPTVRLYIDVLVPEKSFDSLEPKVESFGLAPVLGDIAEIRRTHPRLSLREKVQRLAGGVGGAQIREMPQYLRIVRSIGDRLNWSLDNLQIFRFCLEYPIAGSLLSLRFRQR